MNSKKIKILLTAILVLVSALSINLFAFATEGDGGAGALPAETAAPAAPPAETAAPEAPPAETAAPEAPPVNTQPEVPPTNNDLVIESAPNAQVPTEAPQVTPTEAPTTPSYTPPPTNSYRPSTGSSSGTSFYITLVLNNEEEDVEVSVDGNGFVAVPVAPKKEGFKFDGWYSDEELTEKWDFLTSKATRDTVLYAKWSSLQDVSLFSITVSTNLGGVVTVTPTKAQEGEIVTIKVKPDKGNQLVKNSLSVNGKFIDGYSFEMPANNVIVEAQFESIDAADNDAGFIKGNIGKIVTIAAIAIVVIAIIVWFILNRERFSRDDDDDDFFFVEPMAENEVIRRDDFSKLKRSQLEPIIEGQEKVNDSDKLEINEAEIRKISKTGRINLDQ